MVTAKDDQQRQRLEKQLQASAHLPEQTTLLHQQGMRSFAAPQNVYGQSTDLSDGTHVCVIQGITLPDIQPGTLVRINAEDAICVHFSTQSGSTVIRYVLIHHGTP